MTISSSTQNISNSQMSGPMGLQNGPPQKPSIDDMVNKMAKDLNLSDDQKTQLKTILQKNMSEMDSEMSQSSSSTKLDPKTMMSKMDAKIDDLNKQIKSILTPDQATKFQSIIDAQKSQRNDQSSTFQQYLDSLNNKTSNNTTINTDNSKVDNFI